MFKYKHRSRAETVRRMDETLRGGPGEVSKANSRYRRVNKWTQNLPQILFVVMLVLAGGVLQYKYAKKKKERNEGRASYPCLECRGSGLLFNEHIIEPRLRGGALPTMIHMLTYLDEGYDVNELVCSECRGVGTIYQSGNIKSVAAKNALPMARYKLKQIKAELPFEKLQCDWCSGERYFHVPPPLMHSKDHLCEACFGLGFRYIQRSEDRNSICISCYGMGRVPDELTGKAHECRRCEGFGTVDL